MEKAGEVDARIKELGWLVKPATEVGKIFKGVVPMTRDKVLIQRARYINNEIRDVSGVVEACFVSCVEGISDDIKIEWKNYSLIAKDGRKNYEGDVGVAQRENEDGTKSIFLAQTFDNGREKEVYAFTMGK